MSIEELLSRPLYGSPYSKEGCDLINDLDIFIQDHNNTTEDKLKAIHRLDQIWGVEDPEYPTEEDLKEYLKCDW